jgi:hypothetical protein
MRTASCALYATLGVFVAELMLQGIALIGAANASVQRNFAISLFLVFVVSAAFLEPLATRVKIRTGLAKEEEHSGLFWGVAGLCIGFVFFLIATVVEHSVSHAPLGAIILFLALLFVPGLTTLGWIIGASKGKRAWLYGAILGFVTDFLVRLVLWSITGSILANPKLPPDAFSTALIAACAGGIQAGFFAFCGGLAIDRTSGEPVVRNLAIALFLAILTWGIAYHFIGGYFALPNADIASQINASLVRIADYAGLVLGLALCPLFPKVLAVPRV